MFEKLWECYENRKILTSNEYKVGITILILILNELKENNNFWTGIFRLG